MKRAFLALAAITVTLTSLTACDNRPCISGHSQMILMPIYTGKSMTLVPEWQFVCDKYGPEPKK